MSSLKLSEAVENSYKIVIIGGGVAGLSAANTLLKNNINDFVILEARNRCGGRVIAITLENQKLELGANWIHGILGNPIYELASANGLVSVTQEAPVHNVIAVLPNGEKIPFAILEEIYGAYAQFLKRCEEYFICKYVPPDGINSVGQHVELEISIYLEAFTGKSRDIRQRIFNYLLIRETCISGCGSMNEIDLMEIGSYTELPGGNIVPPGGYSSILGPLMKDIPTEKIWKKHPVETIIWKQTGPTEDSTECTDIGDSTISSSEVPHTKNSNLCVPSKAKVTVECNNGVVVVADHVICTIPLGVLKENADKLFQPNLPPRKLDSIKKLCFGVVDKIFLEYDRPFLDSNLSEVVFLWGEIDYTQPLSERWFKKIYSFYKITETILLGWVSGEEAKYMESLPFDDVADVCTNILCQYLNDPYIPRPKRCICTSWWSQPYTKGSYTSIPTGSVGADLVNVASPLKANDTDDQPTLLFAGEHCHRHFYSTVHGAFLSGSDAARSLCIADSKTDSPSSPTAELSSWIEGISLS